MVKTVSWSGRPIAQPPQAASAEEIGPLRLFVSRAVAAIRRANIQICLAYIAITLLILFVIEAIAFTNRPSPPPPPAVGISDAGRTGQ